MAILLVYGKVNIMPRPNIVDSLRYYTMRYIKSELALSRFQILLRIDKGVLPKPTFIDSAGVRYFDYRWLKQSKAILEG